MIMEVVGVVMVGLRDEDDFTGLVLGVWSLGEFLCGDNASRYS